jgi:hypothetical protein
VVYFGGRGDFNIVWYPCESSCDPRQSQAMVEFSEFIYVQGLMDIALVGGILLGPIIDIMRHDLELIGSCCVWIGKNIFWMYLRDASLESCQFIFR